MWAIFAYLRLALLLLLAALLCVCRAAVSFAQQLRTDAVATLALLNAIAVPLTTLASIDDLFFVCLLARVFATLPR